MGRNYWGFRIDKDNIGFIFSELTHGRLRQGWGCRVEQDLRNLTINEGVTRNLRMFKEVKKNDILLVPELPRIGSVAIVEATEDWNIGYRFEIPEEVGYLGHIFPVKYIKSFLRYNNRMEERTIRKYLRNQSRLWKIDHCDCWDAIEKILNE